MGDEYRRDFSREIALNKKLVTAEHAWELIGLPRAAYDENERLGEFTQASWELCETLHERYKIMATPTMLTQRSARALLQVLEQRRLAGLASPRQVYYLREAGIGNEKTPAAEAGQALTKLWARQRAEWQGQRMAQMTADRPSETKKPDDWLQHLIDGTPDTGEGDSGPARFFDLED